MVVLKAGLLVLAEQRANSRRNGPNRAEILR